MKKYLTVFSIILLVTLAGCVDPENVLTLEDMQDASQVADRTSIDVSENDKNIVEAITNGTSDPTLEYKSIEEDTYLYTYMGKYYDLSRKVIGETEVIDATYNISETTDASEYSIEDISSKDAEVLMRYREFRERKENAVNERRARFGQEYKVNDSEDSVLLNNENVVVEYNNINYSVSTTSTDQISHEEYVYQARLRYENSNKYGQHIIDSYSFTLNQVPKNGTEIWQEALENGGYYGESSSEKFKGIKQRFRMEQPFSMGTNSGTWFVNYEDNLYLAELKW